MKQLIHINEKIWNEEDNLRNSPDDTLVQVCKTIQRENDARCRIKRKINVVTSDAMQEQKSYDTKELLIIPHLGMGDQMMTCGLVRYMSFYYDKIYLATKEKYAKTVKHMYRDDPSIQFVIISDKDGFISVDNIISKYFSEKKIDDLCLGFHKIYKTLFDQVPQEIQSTQLNINELIEYASPEQKIYVSKLQYIPYKLVYEEAKIPYVTRWSHFYIARDIKREREIKEKAVGTRPYIFVHDDPMREFDITPFINENLVKWKEQYSNDLIVYHPNREMGGVIFKTSVDETSVDETSETYDILSDCLTDYITLMLDATIHVFQTVHFSV